MMKWASFGTEIAKDVEFFERRESIRMFLTYRFSRRRQQSKTRACDAVHVEGAEHQWRVVGSLMNCGCSKRRCEDAKFASVAGTTWIHLLADL
jgi:hypothetical protein